MVAGQLFRASVERSEAGYFEIDRDGRFRRVNAAWLRMHGYESADEVIGQHFSLTQVDEDLPAADATVARLLLGESIPAGEFQRRCKDGSIGYHTFAASPVVRGGEVAGLEGFLIDTTQRKLAEQALRESESLLRAIAANYPRSYVSIVERDLTIGFTSGQEFTRLGLNPESFFGLTLEQVFGEHTPLVREHYLTTFAGEETRFELFVNGQHQLYRTVPLADDHGAVSRILVVVENITERKVAEDVLRASEARFRALVQLSPMAIYETDARGRCVYVNPKWCELAGMTPEDALGDGWKAGLHPDDRDQIAELWEEHARQEGPWNREYRFCTPEGVVSWVSGTAIAIRDSLGQVSGYIGCNLDITQSKLAETALRESQERYRGIFEIAPAGVVLIAPETGRIVECNAQAAALLGYSTDELSTLSIQDVEGTETRDEVEKHLHEIMASGYHGFETRLRARDGHTVPTIVAARSVKIGGRPHVLAIWNDISHRKETEDTMAEQLQELRRWHEITLGREERILELKTEVNELLTRAGLPPRYQVEAVPASGDSRCDGGAAAARGEDPR